MPRTTAKPYIPGFANPNSSFAVSSSKSDEPLDASVNPSHTNQPQPATLTPEHANFVYELLATADKLAYLLSRVAANLRSRELSLARTKSQEMKFWLDQHVANNPPYHAPIPQSSAVSAPTQTPTTPTHRANVAEGDSPNVESNEDGKKDSP